MFSNLKTEHGQSNHLLFPASMQISDNLNQYVSLVGSDNTFNCDSGTSVFCQEYFSK